MAQSPNGVRFLGLPRTRCTHREHFPSLALRDGSRHAANRLNLRHSGLTWDIAIRPLSFNRLIRLGISTLAAYNGAQQQVACGIGQYHA
jgi:hypothetical protein